MAREVRIVGLETIGEVKPGDDVATLIVEAAKREGISIDNGDIVVVTSKIISKAEGRIVKLKDVKPSKRALRIARVTGKDPRLVELILSESTRIVKMTRRHLIVKTKHGIVCANAGIDKSNVAGDPEVVALLPADPDASASRLRSRIRELTGKEVAVVITDTYGRPLREGHVDFAIGLSGLKPFKDYRGKPDLFNYILRIKRIAIADEIAAASELVMGNGNEGVPVALIKGLKFEQDDKATARELNMPEQKWLFK